MNFECGKCCSNVLPLTEIEIKDMKKLAKKENKLLLDKNWYMRCPFLSYDNKCDIYKNRPRICMEYDCNKFESNVYTEEMLSSVKKDKYRIVDLRKEIFESEENL